VHSTPLTPPLALWSAQLDQSEASITHGTLDIRAFLKNLEVHNAWCERPCTRHLRYLTPGAGFSPARSGRGTQSCFNHTRYTGYSSFFKKPRSSQHVVRRGWCAPMHWTPALPDTWRWVQPSSIRPRHTVMFQSHTIHWIFELLKKNLKVQRARPVTRGRVPDTTEWGASRVVRGASRVVRARALDPFDTSPGAVVSPA